jgi:hypothetical protein
MSHFYGVLSGSRGDATRCATKKSGLVATAAGWGGCVKVSIHHDEKTETDHFYIEQDNWQGHGIRQAIASGIIGEPTKKENGKETLEALKTLVSEIEDLAIFDDSEKWESILTTAKNAIQKAEG